VLQAPLKKMVLTSTVSKLAENGFTIVLGYFSQLSESTIILMHGSKSE